MSFDIHTMWTLWCISYTQHVLNIDLGFMNQLLGKDIDINIYFEPR
jgi:hypothetical protein